MIRAPLIRPEAQAALWRWREVLAGTGLVLLGLWWIAGPQGLLGWLGWIVALGGVALIATGIQRGRFRQGDGGAGVVQVVEGQVSYYGPLTGGHIALGELSRLRIDHTASPAHWLLDQPGHPTLAIPVDARGVEALFDAFGQLPGLTAARLNSAREGGTGRPVVWQRDAAPAAQPAPPRRLH